MTGINHMREQFEAAFIEKCATDLNRKVPGITREAAIKFITCNWLARSGDDYELPVPNGAWWAWQASREAVVVELGAPSHWVADYAACGGGMTVFDAEKAAKVTDPMCSKTPSYTIHALENAGLKVAP